ncbi:MAG: phosphoribosylamine--glycine ligase [Beijerinckiaceae bacterium]|nr:phosphoribosylamine--glycine ligase [Beijerinckiaceae bacterium]
MNVLLIGSGGREHALSYALAKSPLLSKLFIAPGNPGTARHGDNVVIDVTDHGAVIDFCRLMKVGFVVVGPEAPLVAGLVDDLEAAGIKAFGPKKAAARLEGSKGFTKELCAEFGIPTAGYRRFTDADAAKAHVRQQGAPIVVKYDGLMAGKGVTVATTEAEALSSIDAIYAGEPNAAIVIEDCMVGEEVSFFCLSDGDRAVILGSAQDHKRVFDGDKGPNTGGMGAYSPAPVFTPELEAEAFETIIKPTVAGLKQRGTPYRGVLFAGLMLTGQGPKLVEYNARFGDPECQVLILRFASDLLPLLLASADGGLGDAKPVLSSDHALTVVMANAGYPGPVQPGSEIKGIDGAEDVGGVTVFHAGTRMDGTRLLAAGGRVLNICATGPTLRDAQRRAYEAVDRIDWPQGFCRRDIGWRAL